MNIKEKTVLDEIKKEEPMHFDTLNSRLPIPREDLAKICVDLFLHNRIEMVDNPNPNKENFDSPWGEPYIRTV